MDKLCADNNIYVEFHANVFYIKDIATRNIVLHGVNEIRLYKVVGDVYSSNDFT